MPLPSDLIQVADQYYILASSALADDRRRVLKAGETFGVFDRHGDIQPIGLREQGLGEQGLYHEGTRFVSRLSLEINGARPLLLSSTVTRNNVLLAIDLTNPDLTGERPLAKNAVHVFRGRFLRPGITYEVLRFTNYEPWPVPLTCAIGFDADFRDMFEVRGMTRERRGEHHSPDVEEGAVTLAYTGLDDVTRRSRFVLLGRESGDEIAADGIKLALTLEPGEVHTRQLAIICAVDEHRPRPLGFESSLEVAEEDLEGRRTWFATVRSSHEIFNDWCERSMADLCQLTTPLETGPYPYAGIPWYSTTFGRDGIITALECLWVAPEIARGVLGFLAKTQATEVNPERDAEPGKILHEARSGEMAALGEVPFEQYYGTVDATPLFLLLAAAYFDRTGDLAFLQSLLPSIEAALVWIRDWGDVDGDGFVEYERRGAEGLVNQGWKDSHDSIFHADGSLARGPIALVEVQGYVFAAKRGVAEIFRALGDEGRASSLDNEANELRAAFEEAFWSERIGSYALGLDGDKRRMEVSTSNAGHALFTGIASAERAARTADALLSSASFSGWGIRTLAAGEPRYNPMSYHNGSVWPHDNALIADGFRRYGFVDQIVETVSAIFGASRSFDLQRMPELYCGLHRRSDEGPTLYPVACAPQAWAAGAVFLLLQAALGLRLDARNERISFTRPILPPGLERMEVRRLRVGSSEADLRLHRHARDVTVEVIRRSGPVEISVSR